MFKNLEQSLGGSDSARPKAFGQSSLKSRYFLEVTLRSMRQEKMKLSKSSKMLLPVPIPFGTSIDESQYLNTVLVSLYPRPE